MRFFYFLSALFLALPLLSQKHDNVWMFGYDSKTLIPEIEGTIGSFDENHISLSYIPTQLNIFSTNATISDEEGNLLFYTNGCFIADSTHEIMENGEGVNPGVVYDLKCGEDAYLPYYTSGVQSCLILPKPDSESEYYLFHKHIIYEYEPVFDVITDKLLYTVINTELNNGKGAVVQKNQIAIDSIQAFGQLSAVKHANGMDWWVLSQGYENNDYFTIKVTANGIEDVFVQSIGIPATHAGSSGGGQAVFSPDGTKYVRYNPFDGIFIYDFNRESGTLSNFKLLSVPEIEGVISGGAAISPSSRYLYVSHTIELYQYDLHSADIETSKILIDTFDGFQSPFSTLFYSMQLAPDCRIYMTSQNTVDFLHVINAPDEEGESCNFQQHSIELPYNHGFSIPNFPNFRLGPLVEGVDPEPPCELVVSTDESVISREGEVEKIYVFPNPANTYFKVVFEETLAENCGLKLYSSVGKLMLQKELDPGSREFRVELLGVNPGIYFYELERQGEIAKSGKLIVIE